MFGSLIVGKLEMSSCLQKPLNASMTGSSTKHFFFKRLHLENLNSLKSPVGGRQLGYINSMRVSLLLAYFIYFGKVSLSI